MATKRYNPAEYLISFNGAALSGFAQGTFVEIEFNEDAYMLQVGADGEPARAMNNNLSASVKVTLMQTSASNDVLSASWEADRAGLGEGALLVQDLNGTTIARAESAWVKKMSKVSLGKELSDREWELETGRLTMFVGGN